MKPFSKLSDHLFIETVGFMLREIDYSWKIVVLLIVWQVTMVIEAANILMNSFNGSCNM